MKLFLVLLLVAGAYAQYKSGYYAPPAPRIVSLSAPTWTAPKTIIQGPTVAYSAPQPFIQGPTVIHAAPQPIVQYSQPIIHHKPALYVQSPAVDYMKSGYSG